MIFKACRRARPCQLWDPRCWLGCSPPSWVQLIVMDVIISEIESAVPRFRHLREYLFSGLPTVSGNLSSRVANSSDRYVIALFLGAVYVGYYYSRVTQPELYGSLGA